MTTTPAPRRRVLQLLPLLPALEQRLAAGYDVTQLPAPGAERDALLAEHGASFEAAVTSAARGIDAATAAALSRLRVLSSFGVGLDKIDVASFTARGIPVGYTPDVLNDCVADLAFGLLIDIGRRLTEGDRFVRAGRWETAAAVGAPGGFPLARKISGARLGIVGLGRIGQQIARRASGFSMELRYHSRRPVEGVPYQHAPDLQALARWADYLVVITAGGAATRHLINGAVLDALGPRGFLVNVSRGTVVDEQALLRALQDKRIAGAALDVFEHEPKVPRELFALDNVVLLPHIASATEETRQAMADRVVDNLDAFFASGKLISPAA